MASARSYPTLDRTSQDLYWLCCSGAFSVRLCPIERAFVIAAVVAALVVDNNEAAVDRQRPSSACDDYSGVRPGEQRLQHANFDNAVVVGVEQMRVHLSCKMLHRLVECVEVLHRHRTCHQTREDRRH